MKYWLFLLITPLLVMADHGKIEPIMRSDTEWRSLLTEAEYDVMRKEGTEPSGSHHLNKETRRGVYVCKGCDLPLFHSKWKYDSKTGWPSFWDVIKDHINTKKDFKLIWPRTEYHCARCGSHQGHVFKDGPEPTGLRYCNNGVALKFLADEDQSVKAESKMDQAIFAGGCFWCMEIPFEETEGVIKDEVGYTGGHLDNPSYKEVTAGDTGHYEAIRITYDPERVSYKDLLDVFWRNVDPLDSGGQFCDRGPSYRTAIFYSTEDQRLAAEESKQAIEAKLGKSVVTPIVKAKEFYPAEDYHQDYHRKNPITYKFYRYRCGRDGRLDELWGE